MNNIPDMIAIDGPAGAGKSTVGELLDAAGRDARAQLALGVYVHRLRAAIAAMAARGDERLVAADRHPRRQIEHRVRQPPPRCDRPGAGRSRRSGQPFREARQRAARNVALGQLTDRISLLGHRFVGH